MVIVRIWEGLGNQMFQYAFARSLQNRTGGKVVLDCAKSYENSIPGAKRSVTPRKYQLDYFRIQLPKTDMRKQAKWKFLERKNIFQQLMFALSERGLFPLKFILDVDAYGYNKRYLSMKNSYVMGLFQNERYFSDIRKELLEEFSPKKKIALNEQVRALLGRETVSLHIRRGDYKSLGVVLDQEYYKKAIKYINEHVDHPVYIIFGNDMDWAKENVDCGAETFYASELGNFSDCDEMMLMSYCKHNIVANSTFSWWGAWLNQNTNKIVIAPKKWPMKGFANGYKIIPKDWVKI